MSGLPRSSKGRGVGNYLGTVPESSETGVMIAGGMLLILAGRWRRGREWLAKIGKTGLSFEEVSRRITFNPEKREEDVQAIMPFNT